MNLKDLTEQTVKLQADNDFSDADMEGLLEWPEGRSWAYSCNNDDWYVEDVERLSELFGVIFRVMG